MHFIHILGLVNPPAGLWRGARKPEYLKKAYARTWRTFTLHANNTMTDIQKIPVSLEFGFNVSSWAEVL